MVRAVRGLLDRLDPAMMERAKATAEREAQRREDVARAELRAEMAEAEVERIRAWQRADEAEVTEWRRAWKEGHITNTGHAAMPVTQEVRAWTEDEIVATFRREVRERGALHVEPLEISSPGEQRALEAIVARHREHP